MVRHGILFISLIFLPLGFGREQSGYGYIGPACAVFNGTLWLHGVSKRKLSHQELHIFHLYQQDLSAFNDPSPAYFDAAPPIVPHFCGGLDDSIEVVLDACFVRNNHVYIDDTLIRPLTNHERHRVDVLKMATNARRSRRVRRSADLGELIHRMLRVNSTVTSRFLPVVSQSPIFAMEAPWRSVLEENIAGKESPTPSLNSIDITKIDSPYRPNIQTRKPSRKPVKKPTTTTTTTTIAPITNRIREIQIEPLTSTIQSRNTKEKTVVDPIILQMIAKALKRNQLIDDNDLKMVMSTTTTTTTTEMPPFPMRFVVPQNQLEHNHIFMPTYTSLVSKSRNVPPNPLSHRLPNEICRAHLISQPYRIFN